MTVEELIKKLQKMDPKLPVCFPLRGDNEEVGSVEIKNDNYCDSHNQYVTGDFVYLSL